MSLLEFLFTLFISDAFVSTSDEDRWILCDWNQLGVIFWICDTFILSFFLDKSHFNRSQNSYHAVILPPPPLTHINNSTQAALRSSSHSLTTRLREVIEVGGRMSRVAWPPCSRFVLYGEPRYVFLTTNWGTNWLSSKGLPAEVPATSSPRRMPKRKYWFKGKKSEEIWDHAKLVFPKHNWKFLRYNKFPKFGTRTVT